MRRVTLLLAVCSLAPLAASQEDEPDPKPREEEALELEDAEQVTRHQVTIGDRQIDYVAKAGTLVLREEDGDAKASVFYVSYVAEGLAERPARPITFCFNGGPGSSSVWLHLGALGPRRVEMTEDGNALPPPYRLVDNAHSILDLSDLVFIDPVTTGYSRPAGEEDPGQFHGVDEDVQWVAEFIRLYTTRNRRWESPKFLAGESYGTTRCAGLAGELQGRHGMYLNGILLVSSILDFQTALFDVGNDLPYVLFLPTYAATAFYHGRLDAELSRDLRAALDEVEAFALGPYASALLLGDRLPESEQRAIAEQLARYTGLSPEYVAGTNLRIGIQRFCKELLRGERRTVGRLDSRFRGIDLDAAGETGEYDPSYAAIQGPFTATLNHYVRAELEFESDLPYEILTGRVHPWSFASYENQYLNVGETLRAAMTRNPHLHVFVANGYYDLATPYFATEHTFGHLGLDPALRDHVTMSYYESGHMMYIHRPSLEQFKRDVAAFYARALER